MPQVYGEDMDELPPGSQMQPSEPKGMRWKKRGQHQELEFVTESGGQESTQQSAMQRYCHPVPCFPVPGGMHAANSELSVASIPQPETQEEVPKTPLQRMSTIKNKIRKSTADFFGVGEEEDQAVLLNRKWTQRQHRHYSRRYGQLKPEAAAAMETSTGDVVDAVPGSVTSESSSTGYNFKRRVSRKESVASMAWKGLRHRVLPVTAFQRPESSISTVGRSFTPATILETPEWEDDSAFHEEHHIDGSSKYTLGKSLDDEVFFDVTSTSTPGGPLHFQNEHYFRDLPVPKVSFTDKEGIPSDEEAKAAEVTDGPPQLRPDLQRLPSIRGQRLAQHPAKPKDANRREYGKGLVGRWLNRTIRRKRITSSVKRQLEDICDHRPYFTYWISFVHVLIAIMTVSVYGFAPVGFTETVYAETIHVSQGGYLVPQYASRSVIDNFWIGPDQETLITLGAKFAPCMRYDKLLMSTLEDEKDKESKSGCCIRNDANGCLQTSSDQCKSSFSTFYEYTPGNTSKAVCGQDPRSCEKPHSRPPHEWSKDITKWPNCQKSFPLGNFAVDEYPHLHCEVTGHPCCIGNEARCVIISREECLFRGGHYHEEATLCSQVDCLGAICGLIPFAKQGVPDQVYRLWISLFLHAGLVHLVLTLVFHFTILRDIERMAGWLRVSIIYFLSGVGGYLVSAIIIPYQTEVGPAGSVFGIIACLFVELIQSWQLVMYQFRALFKLCGLVLALIVVGMLPYVDNFAHIAGFVFGFLLAIIFLPYVSFGKWDRRRKILQIFIAFGICITLFTVGFLIFYVDQEVNCRGCEILNCIPFTYDFCKEYNLGNRLQPR